MYNVAFIGTGGVAERHAEALAMLRDVKLAACWSRTFAKTEVFAARYGAKACSELSELLDDETIDVVFVLSSGESHVEYSMLALAAQKHVLVEKPVGMDVGEIETLRQAAAASSRVCMPSHSYIYSPATQRLRHHVQAGKLGRVQSFWMLCNQKQTQEMGKPGVLINDMMIHLTYTSLYFCGPPKRLVATASNVYFESGADDQIGITLSYDNGVIANLWASWATHDVARDPWMCTIKVLGSEGTGMNSWDNVKNHDLVHPGWDDAAYWDSFYYVHRHFFEEVLGRGQSPLSTLDDALLARRVIDAAVISLADEKWVSL